MPTQPGGEFVGFLVCGRSSGRIVKVAMSSKRQRIRATCPHCDAEHETADAMPRPRERGEQCDVTLPADPAVAPHRRRALMHISDGDFLAAVPAADTPVQDIAEALAVPKGSSRGAMISTRAEWLNYDAGETRIVVTHQGAPKPTLLRRVEK